MLQYCLYMLARLGLVMMAQINIGTALLVSKPYVAKHLHMTRLA